MNKFEDVPVWILGNYRCGSIFLCRFLEKIRNNPKPAFYEQFNGRNQATLRKYYAGEMKKWIAGGHENRRELFFENVIDKGLLPPKMKIMRDQFLKVCGLEDTDKELIEEKLPGIKYIHIKREDLCASAVSEYFAKQTKNWVLKPGDKNRYLNQMIPFNEREILKSYHHMKKYVEDDSWDKFLGDSSHYFVDFNTMVKDPINTFRGIINYLEIEDDIDIPKLVKAFEYVPTKRPESKEYIEKLRGLV